ncbi:ThuA domain-containing protein [Seonamhaeicola sp. MEBiC1930]|uniref:ThuA domain-containing protein n=1 Tax=Seonamhaeicola sp. MEBiC01930 TaxID=2976768 RepID=UPI003254DC29
MNSNKTILALLITTILLSCNIEPKKKEVLIFSKTEGYRHKSIEPGIAAIKKLGESNNFNVYATEDANYFVNDSLKKYDAIIFLSTTGDIFNNEQEQSFKNYINNGGGFVGIHAATDTEYEWPWYNKLVGAYFKTHPPGLHEAKIDIIDDKHQSTSKLPKEWVCKDEWYDFKDISKDINVLANLDETTYEGGGLGVNHPISWYQEFDGGKMFYTGLGHPKEAFQNEHFLNHILGGIQYVTDN